MATHAVFAIEYSRRFAALATALGAGPRLSRLDVDDREVTVRTGWAFTAHIPRRARALGLRVRVRRLRLSVDRPDGLVATRIGVP